MLSQEGDEFVFAYSDDFKLRDDVPPVSAFPQKDKVYRSRTLWPFFDVRLPPIDRPDVEQAVRAKRIDTEDAIRLLAEFGRKTVATPYVFEVEPLPA